MDVIALVGPSGTGKSHRALMVAYKNKADAIIDDGILIKNGKIIAGHSAKQEKSKIMAVRRAIFVLPGHAEEVSEAIKKTKPHRIVILGTAENMVQRIAKTLKLPSIATIIHIEDIATKREIEKARFYRLKQGKHIVPVPTIELKPHASGFLIDPIQSFFRRSRTKRRRLGEKSIVRPVFSFYGKLSIDDSVIKAMVRHALTHEDHVERVDKVDVHHQMKDGEDQGLMLMCEITLSYGSTIPVLVAKLQEKAKESVEYMTGMLVHGVDIRVRALYVNGKAGKS